MTLRKKAFTLIEMLVVIAIIAILAAALFPAIQSALNQAKATALKSKGRGIWASIVSANAEREPLSLLSLWPTNACASSAKASDYFNFLMSKGATNDFTLVAQNRIVSDLAPTMLAGAGVPAATGVEGTRINQANMAWDVAIVGDNSASEDVFLLSKNVKLNGGTGTSIDNTNPSGVTPPIVTFDANNPQPFGTANVVWVTRGGGTFSARPKYCTLDTVNGPETNGVLYCDSTAAP